MDLKPPVAIWNTNLEHLSIIWGTMIPKTLLPSSQDGMELLYAPEAVQADRELVMTAVPSQFFDEDEQVHAHQQAPNFAGEVTFCAGSIAIVHQVSWVNSIKSQKNT